MENSMTKNSYAKSPYFMSAVNQLALEYGTKAKAFMNDGFTLTLSARPIGIRVYSPHMPFFCMATMGKSVVAIADECLHDFLQQLAGDVGEPHRLFEYTALKKIDEKLHKHGWRMLGTVQFYLPKKMETILVPDRFSLKWFESKDAISTLYPNEHFPMALSSEYN